MRLEWKCVLFLAASALVWGQGPGPGQGPMPSPQRRDGPMLQGPRQSPGGMWWENSEMVKRLSLTPDQQKKMDDIWQQSRLKLIDLSATLQKEEVVIGGLLRGPQLDDAKILPEFDRVAQARAELEKANARMMLAIRHVLTPEQWEKLNQQGPGPNQGGPGGPMPGPGRGGPPGQE